MQEIDPSFQPAGEEQKDDFEANAFLGQGVNPLKLEAELRRAINGAGGKIDQMFLYTSPASAMAWMEETALDDYLHVNALPIEEVVGGIARRIQKMGPAQNQLEIISLGSAEAPQEQRLIPTLIRKNVVQKIKLFLVDSSYSLLIAGFENCQKVFTSYPNVKTFALYENFYTLQQNKKFMNSLHQSPHPKLITMVGGTLSNLENEVHFVRDVLGAFPPKSMLLIDLFLAYAPTDRPDEIKQKEPWLMGRPIWARLAESRWAIPFMQNHPNVKTPQDVKFVPILDNRTCQIKESYAIEIRAFVGQHQFTIQRLKRHEITPFVEQLGEEGWDLVSTYPFYHNKRLAVLFQKK